MKAQNENYSEKNQSEEHGVEMLLDGGRNRCVDRVCNYFHCNHFGRVRVCRDYGAACSGDVYAHAGRHFLFVYLREHKIPVREKGVYR